MSGRVALAALCVVATFAALPARAERSGLEVRFCPAQQVRAYPLESRREIDGLVLQDAAIINRGPAPVDITQIDIELLRDGQSVDIRQLRGKDLADDGRRGAAMQKAGLLRAIAFQFCDGRLIGQGVTLAGPRLAPGQALLLSST
ncbi:MAG TPA: hypothetical protein VGS12_14765 [Caulobacteraceae bacterium]|nr:hypothetical protein [Caulobacteraceae bacterium]